MANGLIKNHNQNLQLKRVAALYRVSTKKQLDENDIPMQERACRNFVAQRSDWKLVKEYYERGVSGFKVSANKRDAIQQAKEDAEKKIFDVLLVFMFDRLGRRDDETPFVVEWFINQGIEVWSVIEGQQKIEQHTDRLINYLRFWQSSGESRKTSERVNEKHRQMVEDGIFRGGGIPYGYKTVESGKVNKRKKPLLKLVIDEEEAEVVKLIYSLALNEGYGQLRIAKYLNEQGILTRNEKKWGAPTINVILKNPIYKGVMKYEQGEKSVYSKPIPELQIINETSWDKVQDLRKHKNPNNKEKHNSTPISTKGKLLFIGMARCGVCGSRLTSTYFTNKYKSKTTGEVVTYSYSASYRCSGKLQGKEKCTGQATFSAKKIEGIVLKQLDIYLDRLAQVDLTSEIQRLKQKHANKDEQQLKEIHRKLEVLYEELAVLNNEVPKAIMGKSAFNPELLSNLIKQKEVEISENNQKLEELQERVKSKNIRETELIELQQHIPIWKDVFNSASVERKKVMLSYLIDEIYVSKKEVNVKLKIDIEDFIKSTCETSYSGRAPS